MAKSILELVTTIFIVIQVLTRVGAMKYGQDASYIDEDDNGKRRSALAIAGGGVNEDYGDLSDSEYLRRTLRALTVDIASLRKTVRELVKSDLAAIKKVVDHLADMQILAAAQGSTSRSQAPATPQSSIASLLGLGNAGALAGSLLGPGGLGLELAQLVDGNLAQQTAGQIGQASSLQNQISQALAQLLSGHRDMSGLSNGLTTGLASASGTPAQVLLSRLG